jgi:hypothetical protein
MDTDVIQWKVRNLYSIFSLVLVVRPLPLRSAVKYKEETRRRRLSCFTALVANSDEDVKGAGCCTM